MCEVCGELLTDQVRHRRAIIRDRRQSGGQGAIASGTNLTSDRIIIMTRRPGRVKEIYQVPLARPRNVFEIYLEPGFDKAYATLWDHFKSEISVAGTVKD